MKSIYDQIWTSALNTLNARMVSSFELKRKLRIKFPDEEADIERVIDEMLQLQLLNDKKYTNQLVNHLIQRPIGRMKILNEARKRGLSAEEVEAALQDLGYDEESMVKEALESKQKLLKEEDPRKRKQKLMNFLRNRGFRDALIYSALKS